MRDRRSMMTCSASGLGDCTGSSGVRLGRAVCVAALVALLAGCATHRPVLYPNQKLEAAGSAQAQADIDYCIQQAKLSGVGSGKSQDVATSTATGSAMGAAVGAAAGATRGHAGRGAAAGAAGGAAGGLMRGLFRSREPNALEKRYIEACLAERGYRTIGWQ
jgi:hypothetical protein